MIKLHYIKFHSPPWTIDRAVGYFLKPCSYRYKKIKMEEDGFIVMQTSTSKIKKHGLVNKMTVVHPNSNGMEWVYRTDESIELEAI